MSGNIDSINNIQNTNGVIAPLGEESADASSVDSARESILNLANDINSGESGFVSDSGFTTRSNNRRYSYGGIRGADGGGDNAVSDGVNSDNFITRGFVIRGNDRRYSYDADNSGSDGVVTGDYVERGNNRRYSYGGIRGNDDQADIPGSDNYTTNTRYNARLVKDIEGTKSLTAKDFMFQKLDNNRYTYGSFVGGGQQMTRDSALDSLFYSDVANAMTDNGFALSKTERDDIKNFNHEFSDEFASFKFVDSDLLYQQAAIVDGLINNGAFLTPEQEIELGIEGGLTNS